MTGQSVFVKYIFPPAGGEGKDESRIRYGKNSLTGYFAGLRATLSREGRGDNESRIPAWQKTT